MEREAEIETARQIMAKLEDKLKQRESELAFESAHVVSLEEQVSTFEKEVEKQQGEIESLQSELQKVCFLCFVFAYLCVNLERSKFGRV